MVGYPKTTDGLFIKHGLQRSKKQGHLFGAILLSRYNGPRHCGELVISAKIPKLNLIRRSLSTLDLVIYYVFVSLIRANLGNQKVDPLFRICVITVCRVVNAILFVRDVRVFC